MTNDFNLKEQIDKNTPPLLVETNHCIHEKSITQQHKQITLDKINLDFYHTTRNSDTKTYVNIEKPYIQMHFELSSGQTQYIPRLKKGLSIETTQGKYSLFHLPNIDGHLYDPKGKDLKSLEIQLSKDWIIQHAADSSKVIYSFLKNITTNTPALLGNQSYEISPAMQRIIHDLYHCPFEGTTKKLVVEGSIMTLLGLILQQTTQDTNKKEAIALSKYDKTNIYNIKEELTNNYQHHYTIEELALIANMNRTKLQTGFRQLFNCTVHDYIIQTRMNKAYHLLAHTNIYDMNIAEVAKHIGYSHYNHFSNAFKKHFGITPSTLLKKNN
ncbi:helix-turn-helix domain-containing protein [Myroides pelagicus]|uniref:Helix-turn-helix domain-containing protein n=1 Tax=Myroides pelagicus TaxID=270914 RepID=A0A7K1GL79_9FLAO|nr:AraC family transcriptional regulator [Myroides pelagicus]MEC4112565.1 AraC family transcriptional regulator [Myroides pelagicus]MTH29558.1 helix-turn-helix domain-containing protein [Myroides pelagicus]